MYTSSLPSLTPLHDTLEKKKVYSNINSTTYASVNNSTTLGNHSYNQSNKFNSVDYKQSFTKNKNLPRRMDNEDSSRKLEMNGSTENSYYTIKKEVENFTPIVPFKTNTFTNGLPSHSTYVQDKLYIGGKRNNETPIQPIRVNKGLNLNYNEDSTVGFHDQFRLPPTNTIDKRNYLRAKDTKIFPLGTPTSEIKNRKMIGIFHKQKPEKTKLLNNLESSVPTFIVNRPRANMQEFYKINPAKSSLGENYKPLAQNTQLGIKNQNNERIKDNRVEHKQDYIDVGYKQGYGNFLDVLHHIPEQNKEFEKNLVEYFNEEERLMNGYNNSAYNIPEEQRNTTQNIEKKPAYRVKHYINTVNMIKLSDKINPDGNHFMIKHYINSPKVLPHTELHTTQRETDRPTAYTQPTRMTKQIKINNMEVTMDDKKEQINNLKTRPWVPVGAVKTPENMSDVMLNNKLTEEYIGNPNLNLNFQIGYTGMKIKDPTIQDNKYNHFDTEVLKQLDTNPLLIRNKDKKDIQNRQNDRFTAIDDI